MKKKYTGTITKISGTKTRRVDYTETKAHALYKKTITHKKHIIAHDASDATKIGDVVMIEECRPLSKIKHFSIRTVIQKKS